MLAQYQGFADVQMGIGMVVWGLASVIIGEALIGYISLGFTIVGAVMGTAIGVLVPLVHLRRSALAPTLTLLSGGQPAIALAGHWK